MHQIPNSIAILGNGVLAVDATLRKVLTFKECSGPLVILDYTGRGAMILNRENMMGLSRRNVEWHNLADRMRPISLFHFHQSEHMKRIMFEYLQSVRKLMNIDIRDDSLDWAANLAHRLSRDGAVGLISLLQSLAAPETRRWFMDEHLSPQDSPPEISLLVDMLKWALAYPAVYAMSEGINRVSILDALRKNNVIWLEARQELFERNEHALVLFMAEAALEDALKSVCEDPRVKMGAKPSSMVVHLFPPSAIRHEISSWIEATALWVRHASVHRLESRRPLSALQKNWVNSSSFIWVIGKVESLVASCHESWLNAQEIGCINRMETGGLWIKSNKDGKAIVAKISHTKGELNSSLSDFYRRLSTRRLKISPIIQTAGATQSINAGGNGEKGLYEKICDIDSLRLGWQKVRSGRKDSHGADQVTIAMFDSNPERELKALSGELKKGEYRCRPLRRVYIPKHDGSKRGLSIACIRDRVVQAACLLLLDPVFEVHFSPYSFAFRPRRSAHHALALLKSMINGGFSWAVIADIRKCFDTIDHGVLLDLISRKINDDELINLIAHWLNADVIEFQEFLPMIIGVPQGESLSPLLANIYLDPLDKHFEKLGIRFVRYADDITIMTPSEDDAIKAFHIMEGFLSDVLHLEIKPVTKNYVHVSEGFEYLGFKIAKEGLSIRQRKMDEIIDVIQELMMVLGKDVATLAEKMDAVIRINATIRGFRNYFFVVGENQIMQQLAFLDGCIEQMANHLLPSRIKDDPVWICRERFYFARTIEDVESDETRAVREAKSGLGYPEDRQDPVPGHKLIKDEAKHSPSVAPSDTSLVIDAGDEHDSSHRESGVVENGDRLYILMHGSYLMSDHGDLVIKRKKVEAYRRPLDGIGLLFLQGHGMNISVNLQLTLAEKDIPVVFAPPVGHPIAVLNPLASMKSFLRSRQAIRRDDQDIIRAGLNMLAAKVGNQAAVLQYFSKYRTRTLPELAGQLKNAATDIRSFKDKLRSLDPAAAAVRATAMGIEGYAANMYWRMLMRLIPERFGFSGRMKKIGNDVVNQCLNYVYGILYGETWRAIVKAGLDPYFGLIHGSQRDQGSLVFDVIEEFRAPFADRLIIGMLGRGFQPEMNQHGMLRTRTKRLLVKSFSKKWFDKISWRSNRVSPAEILEQQARSLARLFMNEEGYHPFRMKW